MDPRNTLKFAVSDKIDDQDVGPDRVPLALLGEFQKDVTEFLRGDNREVDPNQVMVSIESGSLAFVASGLVAATGLWQDLDYLEQSSSLIALHSKRAAVVLRWQAAAQTHPHRTYRLLDVSNSPLLKVDHESEFRKENNVWVSVEKYLHGRITDMGGQAKPNIHIRLNNGRTICVGASQDQLAQGDKNRMYRDELLHISAEENLATGELRNMSLIAFESYQPRYDEAEFQLMVERGTRAWSNTEDDWLESLRGNKT
jgi:hypothetical protein